MKSDVLDRYAARVGYTPEEKGLLVEGDPRHRHLNRVSQAAPKYSIMARVIEARHCNTGYQAGDRFVLDVDGNLIAKLCPKRLCVYLVGQLMVPVALINERLSEGHEPGAFHFMRRLRCPDVGVECGGYGQVTLQVEVVDRAAVS
ncbi:MAG: hypothetical protein KJ621_10470 [Proteobacteria bacterium]|nr:hypothetical protein [Pseudomonadota bacterium]MBU1742749.1 hypothetical protein [Pseudomonadota bacterium]